MHILHEFKAILILLGGGTEKYIQFGNQQIPRIFSRVFIIVALALCVLSAAEYARQNIYRDITLVLLPVGVALTYFLQILIYICVLMKNQQIFELIIYLEHVVNKRNFSHLFTRKLVAFSKFYLEHIIFRNPSL